ncbi:MAG: phosphatase PAP2 family protein [Clostridia bacterium]|nr:phosphatase PAP2 family protein [Clostridia bacterium]
MYPMLPLALGATIDSAFFNLDKAIFTFFGSMQNEVMTIIAKLFTSFGDEDFVIPMVILAVVLCFFKKTRKYGFTLIFAVAVGTIVTNLALKPMVERVRPYNTLQLSDFWAQYEVWYKGAGSLSESDFSFPSGHTTSAFEMAIGLFICFISENKKKIAWIFPVIAVLTMCSRVYLMVHYPTDVIFGCLAGCVAAIIGYLLAKLVLLIFSKVKFLDNIDAEKLFKKGINPKAGIAVITAVVVAVFCFSFVRLMTEDEGVKCAYSAEYGGEYNCNNKARTGDDAIKYPGIDVDGDGDIDNLCKIHSKELNPQK